MFKRITKRLEEFIEKHLELYFITYRSDGSNGKILDSVEYRCSICGKTLSSWEV